MNQSMSGPCSLAGTSLPSARLGVAVTYPRHPFGSFFQPLFGTGFPFPQLIPKKATRMSKMLPGSCDGAGVGAGAAVGDGEGTGAATGAVTGTGAGAGAATGSGRLGA